MYTWSADGVPLLMAPPTETNRLRQLLLELGCLLKITEIVNIIKDEVRKVSHTLHPSLIHVLSVPLLPQAPTMWCVLACCVLQSLTAVMQGSPIVRAAYDSTVTYSRLRELLTGLGATSTTMLSEALNMVGCS